MGPTLQALLGLQEIELQIVDIRRQLARKDKAVAAQMNKVNEARTWADQERGELRHAQVEVDGLDLDLKARTGQINKLREQLNTVRTNKEYAATLSQMNTEKAEASRVETKALELMGKLEGRRTALAERESADQHVDERFKQLQAELDAAHRSFAEKLNSLQRQRDASAAKLPPEALALFNRVAERYDGEAMAKLIRTNPRRDEFVCSGCNMSINVDRANALLTRDEVQTCKTCGQILYIEPHT